MTGFLDLRAPSRQSEFVRFIEGDIFGKYLFKNYLRNIVGLPESHLRMPIGKWGDMDMQYQLRADAAVRVGEKWLDVEIKLARINIANKTAGYSEPNWAFNNLVHSPSKAKKKYDLLFAIGVQVLGLEHPDYWSHLSKTVADLRSENVSITEDVMPYEPEFLRLCGAFVVPYAGIPSNHFRVMLSGIERSPLWQRFSWLRQLDESRRVWSAAIQEVSETLLVFPPADALRSDQRA